MKVHYPNPWDFQNTDKELISPDNVQKLIYGEMIEIGMGAPIGGSCFLETANKDKIPIPKHCGGPPAWETEGQLVAVPIWSRTVLKGTIAQIGVVDTGSKELRIFAKTFRVLDLRSFHKNTIYGYDSPIYMPKTIAFNIESEKVITIIKLVK